MGYTTYGYGTVGLSILTVYGLYLLLTGQGSRFDFGKFLHETSPYAWALVGIALCVGFSVIGAGW
ncbi:hypothetical protein A1Q2_01127 [Trichosporon asahii var. asahii CBS 8904]|uniref:Uncharacterized protein n=2 Tax=Trichosporon asahii var. asahii TaxID=189963 RepID=K1VK58_TRIAC|nr:hypothetical protein A1Q1_04896 [Trichosporon asahii var. asahii CBS 2479]EJT46502.1 hypothetical protein A1Q1_04896 [Trichosporon asahii var. asahii CBS 2479]EKD04555.1 hypothetical protein A1Q2_01127 [Trichosporon asahii var. asahii CBS 8904]